MTPARPDPATHPRPERRPAFGLRQPSTVLVARGVAAVLHLLMALALVRVFGATDAGAFLAAISAIELASLVGRLGLPVVLTRDRARQGPNPSHLPVPTLACAIVASAGLGGLLGWTVDRPWLVAIGAAAVTVNWCAGAWLRGAARFLAGSALHPGGGLLALLLGLAAGFDRPVVAYVLGTCVVTAAVPAIVGGLATGPTAAWRRAPSSYLGSASAGIGGIVNQVVLLALPIVLVFQNEPRTATVFSLAVGAFRPLLLAQQATNFVVGPRLATVSAGGLTPGQRSQLDGASAVLHLAIVAYSPLALLALVVISRWLTGPDELPHLLRSWAVLLIGYAVAVGTGPAGQVLLMRDRERATVRAAFAGLAVGATWFLLVSTPWLRAVGALAATLATQNLGVAVATWRHERWRVRLASPADLLPPLARR